MGKQCQVADAVCEPKSVQKPHPPITVGGSGERYLLRVTAEHADRFDFGYQPTIEAYKHKLEVLEDHCRAAGTNFGAIEKSCWPTGQILMGQSSREVDVKMEQFKPKGTSRVDFEQFSYAGTPDGVGGLLQPYLNLGVTHFMLFFADLPSTASLRLFADGLSEAGF
jgi:alkanesulfonate monooxygenase SsuD/methylene tetrahydromethanopterin reductase-like flavin-dependent oxidoreductase (luciferase family)